MFYIDREFYPEGKCGGGACVSHIDDAKGKKHLGLRL